jgi:hypothetical protein
MKMTTENKLKIVELTFDIKKLCEKIEVIILSNQGKHCFDSGEFNELNYLFDLAKEIRDVGRS